MKNVLILLLSLCWTAGFSQAIRPLQLVEQSKDAGLSFPSVDLLQRLPVTKIMDKKIDLAQSYQLLSLDYSVLEQLQQERPQTIGLRLPAKANTNLEVELVRVELYSSDFSFQDAATGADLDFQAGVFYRGIVKGDRHSIAAISIFEDEVRGLIKWQGKSHVLGKLNGEKMRGQHIFYEDKEVMQKLNFACGTLDDGIGYSKRESQDSHQKALGNCVRLYFEIDFDILRSFFFIQQAAFNYVSGLYNEVATLYANEFINTQLSQMTLWTTRSPYAGVTSSQMLQQFQDRRTSFNGDLGQLLSNQASGGIAAGFNGLCNNDVAQRLSFSSIDNTFQTVPTFSWDVYVVTHEFGHLFGSRHTHACVWNGNNTAIDGCAGRTEGSCAVPGNPASGGTVMSYCHQVNEGINFNLGFGRQPGNVIRNRVANANCLSACSAPVCPANLVLTPANFGTIQGQGVMQAERTITASNTIANGADMTYSAGRSVTLVNGFTAAIGSEFLALIKGCTPATALVGTATDSPETETPASTERFDTKSHTHEEVQFNAFPNPFTKEVALSFSLPQDGQVQILIFDARGKQVFRDQRHFYRGTNEYRLQADEKWIPGLYFCQLQMGDTTKTIKLMKVD